MNILFLSRLFDPHIGGVEKHVEKISLELIKKGYVITVLTEKFNTKLPSRETIKGINIERINPGKDNWFKKFRIWKNILKNLNLLRDADVIHVHDVFFWYLPFKLIFPRKKVYVTFHGYEGKFPVSRKAIIWRKITNFLSSGAIGVGSYLEKWYRIKCDKIIYGGISMNLINSKFKRKKTLGKHLKIIFLGRLEDDTGFKTYLSALELVNNMGIDFSFKAIGDGSLRQKAKKIGKVLGFVSRPENYIKTADIILTSSYLSILESLYLNKYIIAVYDNPLKKDYLEFSPMRSFIEIESSAKDVCTKIVYFKKNRYSANNNGYEWVKQQTWNKILDSYTSLWSK